MWKLCPECNARYKAASGARCPIDGAGLVEAPDPLLGQVINDRYRLDALLGAGGMGTVYRARHVVIQRDVAIKLLRPELSLDPEQTRRFLGEAEATNLLRHENIVDIFDCGLGGEHLYLVMDLLEGESLAKRLERSTLPSGEAIEVAIDVARALVRAHELRVIHRDIKPGNIFLCKRGTRVKVLDFGVAHVHRDVGITTAGQIFGTPEYMSPEAALSETCTPASDLYSLGATLFEMLTGRTVFEGSMAMQMLHHARTKPPRLRDIDPSQPEALDEVVAKLLYKAPAARHRDAQHLIEELEALRGESPQRWTSGPMSVVPGRISSAHTVVADESAASSRSKARPER